jgi:uncharacterized cupredoxin-like copper-binding protein
LIRRSIALGIGIVAAVTLLVAACGESEAVPARYGDQALFDREADAQLSVALQEFEFDPPTVEITSGELVEIAIENRGTIEHDFSIRRIAGDEAYRIDGEPPATSRRDDQDVHVPLLPGGSGTLRLLATEPGEYELYCSVSGHRRAGMRTTLTVR